MILCTMSNVNNKRPSIIRKENKDKDDAVGSKFSWMEDGKSLSKNLLYTPLVAYHKAAAAAAAAASAAASVDDNDNDDVNKRSNQHHPSQYMSMKSSVPKSLQEVSLVAFLHTVSCDYHRNGNNRSRSTTGFGGGVSNNDAKNNGSRPLGKNDIEGRIRQRAVTLIGGGINSSIIPTNKTFQERTSLSSNNNKKRRQRSWEEIKPILLKNKMNMKKNNQNNDSNDVISFLQGLNVAWNEYIWKVISNPPSSSNKKPKNDNTKNNNDEAQLQNLDIPSLKEIEYQFIALTRINNNKNKINNNGSTNNNSSTNNNYRPIELIGSHVRIESCNSHRSWIGRFGILIGETTNTYRISGYSCTTKRGRRKKTKTKRTKREHTKESSDVISSSTTNTSDVVKEEHEDNYDELEIFLLPKRGSSMVLIVPVPSDTTTTTTTSSSCVNNNNNNNKDGRDDNKNIISLPDKAICISIIDPDDIIK